MAPDDILPRIRRIRDRLAVAQFASAAPLLRSLGTEILRHPVLTNLGPARDEAGWLREDAAPPPDLLEWGADAAGVLMRIATGPAPQPSNLRGFGPNPRLGPMCLPQNWLHAPHYGRDTLLAMIIDPAIEWAEHALGVLPGFSHTVRRWAIRVEAFGIAGLPTRAEALEGAGVPDEHAFQLDLARFLYDQGFDLGRLGREQVLRERTGQGARIDFLLRDRSEVAVELMVVRPSASLTSVNHHVTELRDYCRTGGAAHGMLVVVNLDPKRRLDIRPAEATAPAGVQTGGAHLLITVVEAMRANASAEGSRPIASVDLTAALA